MAVVETQGHDTKEKKREVVGEEFLYYIKGATLRASRSACRQRPTTRQLMAAATASEAGVRPRRTI